MAAAPARDPSPLRARIERSSRPALERLHALPRLLVPVGTVVLILLGVFSPRPYGLVAFAVLFAFIAWIGYLSWPVVPFSGRLMRLAMLVLIIVLAAANVRG